jgi:PKD repeat protein
MAAPSITVSFTSDVNSGAPPFDVQFTDTTIVTGGFARTWFWDFGDGGVSIEQNPIHTFDGPAGTKYTVILTVQATIGEFDAFSFQDIDSTGISGVEQNGLGNTEQDAWSAYQGASPFSFSSNRATWQLTRTGGAQRQYKRQENIIQVTTNFDTALHMLLVSPITFTNYQGTIVTSFHAFAPSTGDLKQTHSRVLGLLTGFPVNMGAWIEPIGHLTDTVLTNQQSGLNISFTLRSFYPTSNQSFEDRSEADFIVIGVPPVADFTASPLKGGALLPVLFENLSTPAIGAPTTYSWKKRKSGSSDSFVEFSTAENPYEIFGK